LFLLTATPVNNRLTDLQHMIELFSRGQADYFRDAPLGIHSLPGHFRKMEKELEGYLNRAADNGDGVQTDLLEADFVLGADALFHALVVQRSRAYVRRSLEAAGDGDILFPRPREPKVQPYSVKQTYGKLLQMVEDAFQQAEAAVLAGDLFPLRLLHRPCDRHRRPDPRAAEASGLVDPHAVPQALRKLRSLVSGVMLEPADQVARLGRSPRRERP
jgi:hypothetical protein